MTNRISRSAKLPQSKEEEINNELTKALAKKRHPRSFWQQKVEEFEKSGLFVRKFCTLHGIAYSTFFSWKQKFLGRKKALPPSIKDEVPEFVPIMQKPIKEELCQEDPPKKYSQTQPIMVHLNGRLHLSIPKDFDGPTLERVVQLLSSQGLEH